MRITEKDAWLRLAETWSRPRRDEYGLMVATNPWDGYGDRGLCEGFNLIAGVPVHLPVEEMYRRLGRFGDISGFLWPNDPVGAEQRMWACLFLAAMCER